MKRILIVAAAVAVAGLGACDKFNDGFNKSDKTGPAGTSGSATTPSTPSDRYSTGTSGTIGKDKVSKPSEVKSDMDVQNDIERALNAETGLSQSAKNVGVSVTNDKIVLSGQVPSKEDKDRVESLAKQNSHGYDVDNKIEVQKQ